MATYSAGSLSANGARTAGTSNTDFHTRRLFDFSDRVAELSPDESPFFVYLSKVAKVPTTDSQFRFLEDRTKVSITDRAFLAQAAVTVAAAGSATSVTFDTEGGANVAWLIPGMVVSIGEDDDSTSQPEWVTVRVNSVVQSSATVTTANVTTIAAANGSTTAVDNNTKCTVIGTAFEEGSGAPDVWSQKLDHDYGYTQIFKTACEMSNTARAQVYRGYADEWQRIWNLKLREHKVDIERAMLFGMRGTANSINYTDGIAGHIIANSQSQAVLDGSQLSYTEDKAYLKSNTAAQWTYDDLLSDFEVIFDPARGGSTSKLALASLPVISHFNKLSGFIDNSMAVATDAASIAYNFEKSTGSFGHRIMKIETVHGDISLVKEPLFRGMSAGFMCMVDLDHVSYRPLVGNGINRDTSIQTNVQAADEDLRKDMILTEAGLEVSLPETHALINLEGV
mgnify:FL=1|jgi:hypothetical protein|tara:strand:- start:1308 stop:2663 length:1356 start_codon:yes stop_codon:yes gene_type:complete